MDRTMANAHEKTLRGAEGWRVDDPVPGVSG